MLVLEMIGKYLQYFHRIFCLLDKMMLTDNVDFGKGPIQMGMITLNVAYLNLFREWECLDSLS